MQPLPLDIEIDQEKTPFVFIEKPQRRLGTLWTNSEVYFSATPLKQQFPALQKISNAFGKWLQQFELVFTQKESEKFDLKYYLEAGIQNYSEEVYALPHALAALRAGQYFVSNRASSSHLSTLAKTLRLRGYQTEPEKTEPNQSLETTPMAVTLAASHPSRQPQARLT